MVFAKHTFYNKTTSNTFVKKCNMPKVLILLSSKIDAASINRNRNDVITWFEATNFNIIDLQTLTWNNWQPLTDYNDKSIEILQKNDDFVPINITDIIRVEQITNEVNFILPNNQYVCTSIGLNQVEEIFQQYDFIRIHQNHLVNVKQLKSFVRCNAFVTLSNSEALPVSEGNDKIVLDFLNNHSIV